MSHLPALNCVSLPQYDLPMQQPLVVTHCLTVNCTLHCSLFVHNLEIKHKKCTALASVPERLNPDTLAHLLSLGYVWASQTNTLLPWLLLEKELSPHMMEPLLWLWITTLQYFWMVSPLPELSVLPPASSWSMVWSVIHVRHTGQQRYKPGIQSLVSSTFWANQWYS